MRWDTGQRCRWQQFDGSMLLPSIALRWAVLGGWRETHLIIHRVALESWVVQCPVSDRKKMADSSASLAHCPIA